jgi:hypothetical protein
MRRATVALAAALAGLAGLAGCGLDPSPAPSSVPASASSAVASTPSAAPSPTLPLNGPSDSLSIVADPGLISSVLGAAVTGLTFQYDADTTTRVMTDAGVRKDASALGIGLYTVTGQTPVEDFAIVSVLRLRDPARADDEWFRSYRDSYDDSACAQAGGVARHSQTEIQTHTVFIGSCAGGAFTYHLRTRTGDLVVSITGVGPGRIGERLAGEVTDP